MDTERTPATTVDSEPDAAQSARWLTDRELAHELHISRAMVHVLRQRGMPSLPIGRARRYNPATCVEWLVAHGKPRC